jgi:prepilin-type N-terminal cleavage/methylation domain-containing protein
MHTSSARGFTLLELLLSLAILTALGVLAISSWPWAPGASCPPAPTWRRTSAPAWP